MSHSGVNDLLRLHIPRWRELPEVELYMDQLVNYVNRVYEPVIDPDELPLTKSMVNNYVKQKVLPAPVKKRYRQEHLSVLIMLFALKHVFSIPECLGLLHLGLARKDGQNVTPEAYDAFCEAVENAMALVVDGSGTWRAQEMTPLYGSAMLYAGKVYLQKTLRENGSTR